MCPPVQKQSLYRWGFDSAQGEQPNPFLSRFVVFIASNREYGWKTVTESHPGQSSARSRDLHTPRSIHVLFTLIKLINAWYKKIKPFKEFSRAQYYNLSIIHAKLGALLICNIHLHYNCRMFVSLYFEMYVRMLYLD